MIEAIPLLKLTHAGYWYNDTAQRSKMQHGTTQHASPTPPCCQSLQLEQGGAASSVPQSVSLSLGLNNRSKQVSCLPKMCLRYLICTQDCLMQQPQVSYLARTLPWALTPNYIYYHIRPQDCLTQQSQVAPGSRPEGGRGARGACAACGGLRGLCGAHRRKCGACPLSLS